MEKLIQIERLVLSCLMQMGKEAAPSMKMLNSDYFVTENHRKIYRYIEDKVRDGEDFDIISIDHKFPKDNIITEIAPAVNTEAFASKAHLDGYISQLIRNYKQHEIRKMIEFVKEEENIADISAYIQLTNEKLSVGEGTNKAVSLQDLYREAKQEVVKIPTTFPRLDKACGGGFEAGRLYVVGASPGSGKTTFMINLSYKFAKQKKKCCFISLEMGRREIVQRFMKRITFGVKGNQEERYQIAEHKNRDITKYISVSEYGNTARSIQDICGEYDVVLVDQLSFMRTSKKHERKDLEVGAIVQELKEYATRENKIVVLATQLNRDSKNTDKPTMHHIKNSSGVEEAADVVMLLHKDDDMNLNLNIGKNRSGMVGTIPMDYDFSSMYIDEFGEIEYYPPNVDISQVDKKPGVAYRYKNH